MQYRQAVAEGRRLVKRNDEDGWRLVELTGEVLAEGKTQRQWAQDIGASQSSVGRWKRIHDRYGAESRDSRPAYGDALSAIMTGDDEPEGASSRRMDSVARSRVKKMSATARASLAAELLKDGEVVEAVVLDHPDAVEAVEDKRFEHYSEEVAARVERRPQNIGRRAAGRVEKTLLGDDLATLHLHNAAKEIADATWYKVEDGVKNHNKERGMRDRITRLLMAYDAADLESFSAADQRWLQEVGFYSE
jgi:hypothetical protein